MSVILPSSLTYPTLSNAAQYLDIVRDRNEMRLVYPITELVENERFSVVLNTSNFVDLRSVKMYAKVIGVHNVKYFFESITLRSQDGTIIEHLDQAHMIAALSDKVSKKENTLRTVFGASLVNNENAVLSGINRDETMFLEIPSFNMLGFFNMKKILRLSTLGALIVDFKIGSLSAIQPASHIFNIGGLKLQNMFVAYDEVEVSEEYLNTYINKYENGGTLNLTYNTVTHSRDTVSGLSGEQTVRIHRSVNKCKFIMSTISRGNNLNLYGFNSYLPPQNDAAFFYQYKLSGQTYPSLGVRTRGQAYKQLSDCLGTNYVRNEINNLSFNDFITNKLYDLDFVFLNKAFTGSTPPPDTVLIQNNDDDTLGTITRDDVTARSEFLTITEEDTVNLKKRHHYFKFTKQPWFFLTHTGNMLEKIEYVMTHSKGGICKVKKDGNTYSFEFLNSITVQEFVGMDDDIQSLTTDVQIFGASFSQNYNAGSFMMGYSLNSVLDPSSRNYGVVDASSAFLTFNYGDTYPQVNLSAPTENEPTFYHVDTFLYHEQSVKVKDGNIAVER